MEAKDFCIFGAKPQNLPDYINAIDLSADVGQSASILDPKGAFAKISYYVAVALHKIVGKEASVLVTAEGVYVEYYSGSLDREVLLSFDRKERKVRASLYEKNTQKLEEANLKMVRKGLSMLAVGLVMSELPVDHPVTQEARDAFSKLEKNFDPQNPNEAMKDAIRTMTGNIYRRIGASGVNSAYDSTEVKVDINYEVAGSDAEGVDILLPVISENVSNGEIFGDEPRFFKTASPKGSKAKKPMQTLKDFEGKYNWNPDRVLSEEDQAIISAYEVAPEKMTISEEAEKIAKNLYNSYGKSSKRRNYIMYGPPGSGKSTAAFQVAYMTGLPYEIQTCSKDLDVYGLTIENVPNTEKSKYFDLAEEDALLKENGIPTASEVQFDPEGSYFRLFGKKAERVVKDGGVAYVEISGRLMNFNDFMQTLFLDWKKACDELKASYVKGSADFKGAYSPIIRAAKYGRVVEIQEANIMADPATLEALNSLLEEGFINIPGGETIIRHPDCVIIMTFNHDLEGTKEINEAVIDRFRKVLRVDPPSKSEVVERIMAKTGFDSQKTLEDMYDFMMMVKKHCNKTAIREDYFSPRSLEDWAGDVLNGEDPYEAAMDDVINKITFNKDDRKTLIDLIDNSFLAKVRKKGV